MSRSNKHQRIIGRLEKLMLGVPRSANFFVIAALFGVLLLLLERGHSMAVAEPVAEIRTVGYSEAITRVLESKLSKSEIGKYDIESSDHPAHLVLRIRGLRVDAKPRAYQEYLVKKASIEPIDAELVLTTRVFKDESGTEMLRIDAQLVNSRDGFRLWSHEFESELTDLDTIYHEICRALAEAMELTVDGANEGQMVQNQSSMSPNPLPRS